MYKRIFDIYILRVYNINTVRIISPLSENLNIFNFNIEAMKQIHTPYCRIPQQYSLNLNIFAVVKFNVAVRIVLIAMYTKSFLTAVVQNPVSENSDIFSVLSVYPSKNQRVLVYIYIPLILREHFQMFRAYPQY